MSKTDWDYHRQNYLAISATEKLSVREYADRHGLNPNSTRRELKKSAKSDQKDVVITTESDQKTKVITPKTGKNVDQNAKNIDQNSGRPRDQNGKSTNKKQISGAGEKGTTVAQKTKDIENNNVVKIGTVMPRGGATQQPSTAGKKNNFPKTTNAKLIKTARATPEKAKPRGKSFEKGNDASLKTGSRATPRAIDYERAEQDLGSYSLDELSRRSLMDTMAHMYRVQDAIIAAVEIMDSEIDNASEPPGDDEEQFGPHPAIKKAKFLMDAGYLFNAHQQTTSAITMARQKLDLDRDKATLTAKKAESALKEAEVIRAAIDQRIEHDWDDIETVEYIESHGVKPPPSMLARALKAIAEMTPQGDDSKAYDEEELDRQAREYAAQKAGKADFIDERSSEVAAMVDRLGLGDYDSTGERKAGEFSGDTESLEIDHKLAQEMYGPDYEGSELYDPDNESNGPIPYSFDDAEDEE